MSKLARLGPRLVADTEELRYRQELARRVGNALGMGKRNLQSICRRGGGAFPFDVLETAQAVFGAELENSVLTGAARISPSAATFPEPLLIDSDWRFDLGSAQYIARTAARCGRVLC